MKKLTDEQELEIMDTYNKGNENHPCTFKKWKQLDWNTADYEDVYKLGFRDCYILLKGW